MQTELPHVTDILKAAALIDTAFMSDTDRDTGTAVHLATQYWDEGTLDVDSIGGRVLARLNQYRRFLNDARPQILAIEQHVVNKKYGYQGTLDRLVTINGRRGVLDIKGATPMPFHGPQLAAYAGCFAEPLMRWDLYLIDDAYKLVDQNSRKDWPVFVAALTIHNWRTEHDRNYHLPARSD